MKKVYRIYCIVEKDVCVPSDGYYSRRDEWSKDTMNTLSFLDEFDTEEEAIAHLNLDKYLKGEYTILPVYKKV